MFNLVKAELEPEWHQTFYIGFLWLLLLYFLTVNVGYVLICPILMGLLTPNIQMCPTWLNSNKKHLLALEQTGVSKSVCSFLWEWPLLLWAFLLLLTTYLCQRAFKPLCCGWKKLMMVTSTHIWKTNNNSPCFFLTWISLHPKIKV